jgi:hypothetical protein
MRPFLRRTIALGCCALTAVAWSGCDAKHVTEYVPGVSTQVNVPRDLKWVRVAISVGGVPQFCQPYKVYDGKVLLPKSLGNFAASAATITNGPVTYSIAGLLVDEDISGQQDFSVCAGAKVNEDKVRILRRSRQVYIEDKTLFLPMPLKYSCYDKACDDSGGEEQTCKGGKCVPATLTDAEIAALKPYTQDLIDGTGGDCFAARCLLSPVPLPGNPTPVPLPLPAVLVNEDTCVYAVANTPSADGLLLPGIQNQYFPGPSGGDGVNVEVVYDGGLVTEILDLDPQEGFTIPDPSKPQRFQLAPGLCEQVKGIDSDKKATAHRITAIRASAVCRSKRIDQPLCADDQLAAMGADTNGIAKDQSPGVCAVTELKPPQSVLMVVADNTTAHQAFYTALANNTVDPNNEDTLVQPAIKGALSDPAFERTDIGLIYAPGQNQCKPGDPEKVPVVAGTARDPILQDLNDKGKALLAGPPALGGALERAYTYLRRPEYASYFRKAVLVLANEGFDDDASCGPTNNPLKVADTAFKDVDPILTYVMQLTKIPDKPTGTPWDADKLAAAGGTGTAAYRSKDAQNRFEDVVDALGTCVYDTDNNDASPKDGDVVAFTTPFPVDPSKDTTKLTFNSSCNGDAVGNGDGWGFSLVQKTGKKRVYLCPNSCKAYRDVLKQTTQFAAIYQQPPIPVPVFQYRLADKTNGCGAQGGK